MKRRGGLVRTENPSTTNLITQVALRHPMDAATVNAQCKDASNVRKAQRQMQQSYCITHNNVMRKELYIGKGEQNEWCEQDPHSARLTRTVAWAMKNSIVSMATATTTAQSPCILKTRARRQANSPSAHIIWKKETTAFRKSMRPNTSVSLVTPNLMIQHDPERVVSRTVLRSS